MCERECVCVCERERVCVRERVCERESACVRESVYSVCVCVRERERPADWTGSMPEMPEMVIAAPGMTGMLRARVTVRVFSEQGDVDAWGRV